MKKVKIKYNLLVKDNNAKFYKGKMPQLYDSYDKYSVIKNSILNIIYTNMPISGIAIDSINNKMENFLRKVKEFKFYFKQYPVYNINIFDNDIQTIIKKYKFRILPYPETDILKLYNIEKKLKEWCINDIVLRCFKKFIYINSYNNIIIYNDFITRVYPYGKFKINKYDYIYHKIKSINEKISKDPTSIHNNTKLYKIVHNYDYLNRVHESSSFTYKFDRNLYDYLEREFIGV
jgi:hypothetical protein